MGAISLGDASLHGSYFICLKETAGSTLIEYGKTQTSMNDGDVYLIFLDIHDHIPVRYYSFGNRDEAVNIYHVNVIARNQMNMECKGDTQKDLELRLCVPRCHELCDPMHGNCFLIVLIFMAVFISYTLFFLYKNV